MTLWVLLTNEPKEGSTPHGVYSSPELAMAAEPAASYIRGFEFATVAPFEVDAAPNPPSALEDDIWTLDSDGWIGPG